MSLRSIIFICLISSFARTALGQGMSLEDAAFGSLKNMVEGSFQEFNKAFKRFILPGKVISMLEETEEESFDFEPEIHRLYQTLPSAARFLEDASSCQNGAIPVNVNRIYYYCGSTAVSKDQYNARVARGDSCQSRTDKTPACYCPRDYYGQYCETWNDLICKITDDNAFKNCTAYDSKYYMSSIDNGFPPCNFVTPTSVYKAAYNLPFLDSVSQITLVPALFAATETNPPFSKGSNTMTGSLLMMEATFLSDKISLITSLMRPA